MKTLLDSTQRNATLVCRLAMLFLLAGCSPVQDQVEITGRTMGTTYTVKIVDADLERSTLADRIDERLIELNEVFSTYIVDSELSLMNSSPETVEIPVSKALMSVLHVSGDIYSLSDGAFDVTVGPLVNLWGFGPDGPRDGIPDQKDLAAALSNVGFSKVVLGEDRLSRPAGLQIDLSSIAKGYAVDEIATLIESRGAIRYMVEIGGEVRARGTNQRGTPWIIGVEAPERQDRRLQRTLPIRDLGMATSGDYRNFFEHEGQRYTHTLDPRTGWPVTHDLASVTVLHPQSAMADGLATAFSVLGLEQSLVIAEAQRLPILAIIRTGNKESPYKEVLSSEMKRYLAND
jgi:thiamine biosynthesis lipoprotein